MYIYRQPHQGRVILSLFVIFIISGLVGWFPASQERKQDGDFNSF